MESVKNKSRFSETNGLSKGMNFLFLMMTAQIRCRKLLGEEGFIAYAESSWKTKAKFFNPLIKVSADVL